MAKKITAKMLKKLDACGPELKKFKKEFPQGMIPNENGIAQAAAIGLPISWCYEALLSFDTEQVNRICELDDEIWNHTHEDDQAEHVVDVALLPILFREQGWLD